MNPLSTGNVLKPILEKDPSHQIEEATGVKIFLNPDKIELITPLIMKDGNTGELIMYMVSGFKMACTIKNRHPSTEDFREELERHASEIMGNGFIYDYFEIN